MGDTSDTTFQLKGIEKKDSKNVYGEETRNLVSLASCEALDAHLHSALDGIFESKAAPADSDESENLEKILQETFGKCEH